MVYSIIKDKKTISIAVQDRMKPTIWDPLKNPC